MLEMSLLVEDGRVAWIAPDEPELALGQVAAANEARTEVVDASGITIVPGLVDCHAHVTGPGGAHWIERFADAPSVLLAAAEANGRLASQAGVRWLRDVGSPIGVDPIDGRRRALALGVRDRWRERPEMPYLRAAGSWLMGTGTLPAIATEEAADADELLAAALRQLDAGADLLKLYLDGPDPATTPWTAAEVRRVVQAAHGRGIKV